MPPPRIAVTAGEPAGIGPDILLDIAREAWPCSLVAIADPNLLRERAAHLALDVSVEPLNQPLAAKPHLPGTLAVQQVQMPAHCEAGRLDSANAPYVLETLRLAVQGCQRGDFDAMVTAPVQKSVINEAGIPFSGHTEYLAAETDTPRVVMMLASSELRVALATTHLPLSEVPAAINAEMLRDSLRILVAALSGRFGLSTPTVAVLGLNPHAGEGGHLGREEIEIITPVLESLRAEGMHLLGPLPADTAFNRKVLERCDAVFAMYHDQGLPVLKYAGFGSAVNITLGLPIIRTSVDHGTALDVAGTGEADAGSLREALRQAIAMAESSQSLNPADSA